MVNDIEVFRGDDKGLALQVYQNGSIIDVGSWVYWLSVKEYSAETDADALLLISGVISGTNAVSGVFSIPITNTQTSGLPINTHCYDIQLRKTTGSVYTPVKGDFIVNDDVTKVS